MGTYKTISQAREVADGLYPTLKHEHIQKKMGVDKRLYDQIRQYDSVTVSERLTEEDEEKLREFIQSCAGIAFPKALKIKPKTLPELPPEPVEKPWTNPFPDSPLMVALEKLGDAADQVKALGYEVRIGVTKKEDTDWESNLQIDETSY